MVNNCTVMCYQMHTCRLARRRLQFVFSGSADDFSDILIIQLTGSWSRLDYVSGWKTALRG